MSSAFLVALGAFAALSVDVSAHPTKYPQQGPLDCKSTGGPTVPPILSYHTHIVYMLTDPEQTNRALALRDRAREHFQPLLGEDCDGRYDEGRLCMINDHNLTDPMSFGPFPTGEWSMFVPISYYANVMPWFTQNRGEFSFLVHPNTGCEYEDHDSWAQWCGQKWPLNMNIFTQYTQTEEFNGERGDAGNPVCLPANAVCGNALELEGPSGVCCEHLACRCPNGGVCTCAQA